MRTTPRLKSVAFAAKLEALALGRDIRRVEAAVES